VVYFITSPANPKHIISIFNFNFLYSMTNFTKAAQKFFPIVI